MRGERLCDFVGDAAVSARCLKDFSRQVAARVSSGREKVRVDGDVARSLLDQLRETFKDVRMSNLQEGGGDQGKATALADAARGLAHVAVGLFAAAAMPDDQHRALC